MSFRNFRKKGGVPVIFHKKGGVGEIGVLFLKKGGGVSLIFILTYPFQCYLSLSVWCLVFDVCVCVCVCVFCLFTPFLSALFVFDIKSLVI